MLSNDTLQALSARLAEVFPAAEGLRRQLEADIHEILQSSFASLNLVTREEFERQLLALQKAEEQIAELEARIAALEEARQADSATDSDQTSGS